MQQFVLAAMWYCCLIASDCASGGTLQAGSGTVLEARASGSRFRILAGNFLVLPT
jgi:hypothetical protein